MKNSTSDNLLTLISEDWRSHGCDWTRPGFRAMAVHRFGNWRLHFQNRFLRGMATIIYRFFYRYVRNHYGIELPYTVELGRNVTIEHQHGIVIHGYSKIGDGTIIRHGVTIGNQRLERPLDAPVIGKNVNIGAGAKILGNITIGNNVTIGANAVVICDAPDNCTLVGVPAKCIEPANSKEASSHV